METGLEEECLSLYKRVLFDMKWEDQGGGFAIPKEFPRIILVLSLLRKSSPAILSLCSQCYHLLIFLTNTYELTLQSVTHTSV